MRSLIARLLAAVTVCVAVPALATASPTAEPLEATVRRELALTAMTIQNIDLPGGHPGEFTIALNLAGQPVEVDLAQHSVRAPGFRLLVDAGAGPVEIPAPPVNTYHGNLAVGGNGTAALSLVEGGLTGMIVAGEGAARQVWFIQPLADAVPGSPFGAHVVYREQDRAEIDADCGVEDGPAAPASRQPRLPGGVTDLPLICQIACEADFEYYNLLGANSTSVTNDITAVVNTVSAIYTADANVKFEITTILIRTTAAASSHYTSASPQTRLQQMAAHWASQQGSIVRDIAHTFTGVDLTGTTIGIAYLPGVCSFSQGYGLVQSRFTGNMAFRTALSAHELGHNFSAGHCDSCSPCYIMCSGLGGCAGVISTFGPCNAAGITAYAASRPCLTPMPPPVLALPFLDRFDSSTTLNADWWTNIAGAGITSSAPNEPSSPNSLLFLQTASIETRQLNTAGPGRPIFLAFRSLHSGVEAGETVQISAFNEFANVFQPMASVVSSGVNQTQFVYQEFKLPLTALSNTKGAIRFATTGVDFDDAWYIDDVSISIYCRADINKDGLLNLGDFGAFQNAFALGNMLIADFNNDGTLNLADFGSFQTAFALGCY